MKLPADNPTVWYVWKLLVYCSMPVYLYEDVLTFAADVVFVEVVGL
jgi:hypothetical protein